MCSCIADSYSKVLTYCSLCIIPLKYTFPQGRLKKLAELDKRLDIVLSDIDTLKAGAGKLLAEGNENAINIITDVNNHWAIFKLKVNLEMIDWKAYLQNIKISLEMRNLKIWNNEIFDTILVKWRDKIWFSNLVLI